MAARADHGHLVQAGGAVGLWLLDRSLVVGFDATLPIGAVQGGRIEAAGLGDGLPAVLVAVALLRPRRKDPVPLLIGVNAGNTHPP